MKRWFLLCLLLQLWGSLGLPLFELSSKADDALQMALNSINAQRARAHLYRVSKASVKRIVPLGMNSFDLHLKFGIRETECHKSSGVDPQGCMYRKGLSVSEAGCYMRARTTQEVTRILSLRCTNGDNATSESSAEGRLRSSDINHSETRTPTYSTLVAISTGVPAQINADQHDNKGIHQDPGDLFNNYLPLD